MNPVAKPHSTLGESPLLTVARSTEFACFGKIGDFATSLLFTTGLTLSASLLLLLSWCVRPFLPKGKQQWNREPTITVSLWEGQSPRL
jgi:hypothetical protein